MAELKSRTEKARFGDVREITAVDYVQEVNKAGEGIMVVLHLYKQVSSSAESFYIYLVANATLFDIFVVSYMQDFGFVFIRYGRYRSGSESESSILG
jgi:hypothetical protein